MLAYIFILYQIRDSLIIFLAACGLYEIAKERSIFGHHSEKFKYNILPTIDGCEQSLSNKEHSVGRKISRKTKCPEHSP